MAARLGHPLCPGDIAAHAGLSTGHLRPLLRCEIGFTLARALRLLRLGRAEALIRSTQRSFIGIALETGLTDAHPRLPKRTAGHLAQATTAAGGRAKDGV